MVLLGAQAMGDKTDARKLAEECNVPVVPGSAGAITDAAEASAFASQAGYPVILKAAYGGGGRGMRVVRAGVTAPALSSGLGSIMGPSALVKPCISSWRSA